MSNRGGDARQSVYAAAQGREFLRGQVKDKPNEWVREFAGLVDDDETLRLLNYYSSIYEERGMDFLETHAGKMILRAAATTMADGAFTHGNVSQLQGMVGLTKNQRDAEDALAEIVKRLSDEGTIAVVVGPPGSGKTSTTLDITRAWGAWTGGRVYGNTGWDGFDAVVHSDLELLEAMASQKGKALGVIDEAAQSLTGRGADSKKAETFANRMTFIRKQEGKHGPHAKQGSLLTVSHNWDRMNAPTRRLCTLVIAKPSRRDPGKVVLYESPGGEDKREKIGEFVGLTDTRESYPEHEASHFDVVLEDDDEDSGADADEVRRTEAIAAAVRACKPWTDEDGMSYADAASIVGYSDSWVGDRVREWADGKHRELVSAPEGETA
jgi:hypothetical protein